MLAPRVRSGERAPPQLVLVHAIAQRVARDAQRLRRHSHVAAGLLQGAHDQVTLHVDQRRPARVGTAILVGRTERVLGIWVNVDSREFLRVPSYLAVLSNRPVSAIANPDALRRFQIGLDNFLLPQRIGSDFADTVRDDPFRQAFVRLQTQQGLYRESSTAVTFLTPTVFRAAIPMPAAVPT